MLRVLALTSCIVAIGMVGSAQELMLGPVPVALGAAEITVIAELRQHFSVRPIEGGWEVRSRDANDLRAPLMGVGARAGRIRDVSAIWGPGLTPSLEVMSVLLSHALPANAQCQVQSVVRASEGGTVRTLIFRCGSSTIRYHMGLWPQGSTAGISIRSE